MAKRVVLSVDAQDDIEKIISHIVQYTYSLSSGAKLLEDLKDKIELIGLMPEGIGRLREDGKREAFCRGYRIVYQLTENEAIILTIIHSRMLYPQPE